MTDVKASYALDASRMAILLLFCSLLLVKVLWRRNPKPNAVYPKQEAPEA